MPTWGGQMQIVDVNKNTIHVIIKPALYNEQCRQRYYFRVVAPNPYVECILFTMRVMTKHTIFLIDISNHPTIGIDC